MERVQLRAEQVGSDRAPQPESRDAPHASTRSQFLRRGRGSGRVGRVREHGQRAAAGRATIAAVRICGR